MPTITQVAQCRKCAGAAYQAPPAWYAGNKHAPILVVAQNPGEMHDPKEITLAKFVMAEVEASDNVDSLIRAWYTFDFSISKGATRLAEAFGEGWLRTGHFCYTNAVLCRTSENKAPSSEMISKCATWTSSLMFGKKLIISVGGVARDQVDAEMAKYPSLEKTERFHIAHYSAWADYPPDKAKLNIAILKALA